jgi:methionine-rich copper-binding protein CopC
MHIKQKFKKTYKKFRQTRLYTKISIIAGILMLAICLGVFLQTKTVHFSYASQESCTRQLTILPDYSRLSDDNAGFEPRFSDTLSVGNFKMLSFKTCFPAKKVPKEGQKLLNIAPFGSWFGSKTYNLNIPSLPTVSKADPLFQPLPTKRSLVIGLSDSDQVFDYQISANDKTAKCAVSDYNLSCDVQSLGLLSDKVYDIKVSRSFDGKDVDMLVDQSIRTVSATKIVSSSVRQNQVIFEKPKKFTVTFDKKISDIETTLEKIDTNRRTKIKIDQTTDGKIATVIPTQELERDKSYELTVASLVSSDGGGLDVPYVIKFKLSSGPGISSISAGSISSPLTQTITLTLDQAPKAGQDVSDFVTAKGFANSVSSVGNKIYISYANAPLCTDLTVSIKPGLVSSYGIVQTKPWSFTTRTVCYTTSVIGYSRQGRPIMAYYFGSGSQVVLYVGSIHGNEYSTKYLLDEWIDELETNANNIPDNRKLVVVPLLNPDGLARSSRYNAGGVDLNRNFPTEDWQKNVYSPSNQLITGGGGSTSLSEPESKAIANLSTQLRPILTMSFHGSAGYAIANQAAGSAALAAKYAQMTGYNNMTGVSGAFSYPITGTYDDWLREKYGLKSILIELSSNTYSEFSRNKAALWAMAET